MPLSMRNHQHGTSVRSHVWHGSILYIFPGSIRQAKLRARCYPLMQSSDVADVCTTLNPWVDQPVIQAASLVWMDDTPYLFPGSLTEASGRGKGYKTRLVQVARERRRVERHVLSGFLKQYGTGIGDGK